jgi:hypothetical protein
MARARRTNEAGEDLALAMVGEKSENGGRTVVIFRRPSGAWNNEALSPHA